jgi:hypothetical protein
LYALIQWRRLPLPVAAVALLIPAYFVYLSGSMADIITSWSIRGPVIGFLFLSPVFLAGAIGRGRWRDIVIAIILCVTAIGIEVLHPVHHDGWSPCRWLIDGLVPILAFAVAEWLGFKRRNKRSFIWLIAAAVGAGCLITTIKMLLQFTSAEFSILHRGGRTTTYQVAWLLHPAISAILLTSIISWSLRARLHLAPRVVLLSASLFSIAAFAVLFGPAIVPLARYSMGGRGPFSRIYAATIVSLKGTADDTDCLYRALEQSNWPDSAHSNLPLHDWQDECVDALTKLDPPRAGAWFSKELRAAPSDGLVDEFAPVLGAQHRYEMAPLMFRHVFRNAVRNGSPSVTRPTVDALEEMHISQMAKIILIEERIRQTANQPNVQCRLGETIRKRLTRLLGSDAGPEPHQWDAVYEAAIESTPTPLSAELRREVDALVNAFTRYLIAEYWLYQATHGANSVSPPNIWVTTTDEFVRELDAYVERVDKTIGASRGLPGGP